MIFEPWAGKRRVKVSERRIDNADQLTREVAAWEAGRNAAQARLSWRFTTDDARIRLKKLYLSVEV